MKYPGFIIRAVPYLIVQYPLILANALRKEQLSYVRRYRDSRRIVTHVNRALHIRLVLDGAEKLPAEPSFMLAPNHQSFLDALCLIEALPQPMAFIAKKESKHYPMVGRIITALDSLYLDRRKLRQEIRIMQEVKKSFLTENKKWVIFPEGTRTRDPDHALGEFKPGSVKAAMQAKVKIFPVAMWGSFRVLSTRDHRRRYPVFVSVLDPLLPEEYEALTTAEVTRLLKERISARLQQLKEADAAYKG